MGRMAELHVQGQDIRVILKSSGSSTSRKLINERKSVVWK